MSAKSLLFILKIRVNSEILSSLGALVVMFFFTFMKMIMMVMMFSTIMKMMEMMVHCACRRRTPEAKL